LLLADVFHPSRGTERPVIGEHLRSPRCFLSAESGGASSEGGRPLRRPLVVRTREAEGGAGLVSRPEHAPKRRPPRLPPLLPVGRRPRQQRDCGRAVMGPAPCVWRGPDAKGGVNGSISPARASRPGKPGRRRGRGGDTSPGCRGRGAGPSLYAMAAPRWRTRLGWVSVSPGDGGRSRGLRPEARRAAASPAVLQGAAAAASAARLVLRPGRALDVPGAPPAGWPAVQIAGGRSRWHDRRRRPSGGRRWWDRREVRHEGAGAWPAWLWGQQTAWPGGRWVLAVRLVE